MNDTHSNTMKKFMKKPGNLYFQIFLVLCIVIFTIFGIYSYVSPARDLDAMKANAEAFDPGITSAYSGEATNSSPSNTGNGYSQISVQYLSDAYAANGDDTILYCIAFDANYNSYIVAIRADEMPIYQELMVFSKSDLIDDSTTKPAPIPMTGVPEKISEDIAALSTAALNKLVGQEAADNSNYTEVYGAYLLNTTTDPSESLVPLFACLVIDIIAVGALVYIFISQKQYKWNRLSLMDRFSEMDLENIELDVNQPSTVRLYKNIYMSENYLLSRANGMSIIPLKDIIDVNVNKKIFFSISAALYFDSMQSITVVTRDGAKYEIFRMSSQVFRSSITETITTKIKKRVNELNAGAFQAAMVGNTAVVDAVFGAAAGGTVSVAAGGAVGGAVSADTIFAPAAGREVTSAQDNKYQKTKYSAPMKKLLRKPQRLVQILICIVFIGVFIALGNMALLAAGNEAQIALDNPTVFDPGAEDQRIEDVSPTDSGSKAQAYSKLSVQYLSRPVVTYDDEYFMCIALDEDFYAYIVKMDADQYSKYQSLVDFTYDSSLAEWVSAVSMQGVPKEIPENAKEYIAEGLNIFFDDEFATSTNLSEVVGTYYLDTTSVPEANYTEPVGYFALLVAAVIAFAFFMMMQQKEVAFHQDTLNRFTDRKLFGIDQELNQPSTTSFMNHKLFITENYLISKMPGIDILSLSEIVHVYGFRSFSILRKKQGIMAVTGNGVKHKIALLSSAYQEDYQIQETVDALKKVLPNIKYGFESGFYYEKNANPAADEGAEPASNVPLGILGAILGASLASILWILIGMIGFIAGLVGYVMVLLAIRGYGLLAGSIDRKGKIIAICIAFIMLFVANYASYAFIICKENNTWSIDAIMNAFDMLPQILSESKNLLLFAGDIALGLVFSVVASFRLIKDAFKE